MLVKKLASKLIDWIRVERIWKLLNRNWLDLRGNDVKWKRKSRAFIIALRRKS